MQCGTLFAIIIHPSGQSSLHINMKMLCFTDIGLIKLPINKRFNMSHGINIAPVSYMNMLYTNNRLLNSVVQISGWGDTEYTTMSSRLKIGYAQLVDISNITAHFQGYGDIERLLVGDNAGSWTCRGDSGGKIFKLNTYF